MSQRPIGEVVRREFRCGGALEIMGRTEAADVLGVHRTNLTQLKGLPRPLFRLKAGTFWLASDIREFAERR